MKKKVEKQIRVEFLMPASMHAKMMLRLYSPLEERVPYGAIAKYMNDLVREDQKEKTQQAEIVNALP